MIAGGIRIDTFITELLRGLPEGSLLDEDAAHQIYEHVVTSGIPAQDAADALLSYFNRISMSGRRVLAPLFDPRFASLAASGVLSKMPNVDDASARAAALQGFPEFVGRHSPWLKTDVDTLQLFPLFFRGDSQTRERELKVVNALKTARAFFRRYESASLAADLRETIEHLSAVVYDLGFVDVRTDAELESCYHSRFDICDLALDLVEQGVMLHGDSEFIALFRQLTEQRNSIASAFDLLLANMQRDEELFARPALGAPASTAMTASGIPTLQQDLLDGRIAGGTFEKLIESFLAMIKSHRPMLPKWATEKKRPGSVQELRTALDAWGLRTPAEQECFVNAWISDALKLPTRGKAFSPPSKLAVERMTMASKLRLADDASLRVTADTLEARVHLLETPDLMDLLPLANLARAAGFEEDVIFDALASFLIESPNFHLFDGIMSPQEMAAEEGHELRRSLAYYIAARAAHREERGRPIFESPKNLHMLSRLQVSARLAGLDQDGESPRAARLAEEAADIAAMMPVLTADEADARDVASVSIYALALAWLSKGEESSPDLDRIRAKMFAVMARGMADGRGSAPEGTPERSPSSSAPSKTSSGGSGALSRAAFEGDISCRAVRTLPVAGAVAAGAASFAGVHAATDSSMASASALMAGLSAATLRFSVS